MERRLHAPGLRFDHGRDFGSLLGANRRGAAFDDGGFFARDRHQRVAEKLGVIHADGRDHARERRVDHTGGIEPPAKPDFQQHHIGRMLREQTKGGRGLDFKNRDRRAGIGSLAMFKRRAQFLIVDERAAAFAAKAKTFVDRTRYGEV